MSSKTVRTLYRLFLRQARALERQGLQELPIRAPVNLGAAGWFGRPAVEAQAPNCGCFCTTAVAAGIARLALPAVAASAGTQVLPEFTFLVVLLQKRGWAGRSTSGRRPGTSFTCSPSNG